MKIIIKLSLNILVMITAFLVLPDQMNVLEVGAASETPESDLAGEEAVLKVEKYLNEYSKGLPRADLATGNLEQKEYTTKEIESDYFTEEQLVKILEKVEQERTEEMIALVEAYLDREPLVSKNAMLLKLEKDTYTSEEIEVGLESIDIDWKDQAVKASEQYINIIIKIDNESHVIISRKSLLRFLVEEKHFTLEEASYGVEESAIDWGEQAFKQAEHHLTIDIHSKISLMKKLILDDFNSEEAEYGVTQTQTDWKEQAVKKSDGYFAHSLVQSKENLVNFLKLDGFSEEETDYAVNLVLEDIEEELDLDGPGVGSPGILAPEKLVIIEPLELNASQVVILGPEVTDVSIEIKDSAFSKSSSISTKKSESTKEKISRMIKSGNREDIRDLEETSLFDSPNFAPVLIFLIVGNLYLFQRT